MTAESYRAEPSGRTRAGIFDRGLSFDSVASAFVGVGRNKTVSRRSTSPFSCATSSTLRTNGEVGV